MSVFSRFSLWISKDPMQRALYLLVPLAHIALFGGFLLATPQKKTIDPKKLVIKTFSAPTSQQALKTAAIKTAATKNSSTPVKKAAPKVEKKIEKKPEKKEETKAPPAPKKTPSLKKEKTFQVQKQKTLREEHLKELEERIAKIEVKNDRMPLKSELTVPTAIALSSPTSLQAPKEIATYESSFASEDFVSSLIGYLQGYLHLPDVGEVQIQLTLRKDGKVENMKIIKAESDKNKKYLEEQLPKLSFPLIYLNGSSSQSFLFTFCNKF